jgi:hypothetical protein
MLCVVHGRSDLRVCIVNLLLEHLDAVNSLFSRRIRLLRNNVLADVLGGLRRLRVGPGGLQGHGLLFDLGLDLVRWDKILTQLDELLHGGRLQGHVDDVLVRVQVLLRLRRAIEDHVLVWRSYAAQATLRHELCVRGKPEQRVLGLDPRVLVGISCDVAAPPGVDSALALTILELHLLIELPLCLPLEVEVLDLVFSQLELLLEVGQVIEKIWLLV